MINRATARGCLPVVSAFGGDIGNVTFVMGFSQQETMRLSLDVVCIQQRVLDSHGSAPGLEWSPVIGAE